VRRAQRAALIQKSRNRQTRSVFCLASRKWRSSILRTLQCEAGAHAWRRHGARFRTLGVSIWDYRASGIWHDDRADSGTCGRLARSALGAHEEVERSRPETVALSDRLQPAYQKVLERNPGGGVGSGQRFS
jgi:hypothetical protein